MPKNTLRGCQPISLHHEWSSWCFSLIWSGETTGESQMSKGIYIISWGGKNLLWLKSRKQPQDSSTQPVHLAQNILPFRTPSVPGHCRELILSKCACPCHVSLSCLIKEFGSGCGQASLLLPSFLFPILCLIWFRSPCSALPLTSSSNSHPMSWPTPISLYQNFDRTAKKMRFIFPKFVLLSP